MLGNAGDLRKRCADFMTDKAYPTVDLRIFGVSPLFLRSFYDLPRILNTSIGSPYSRNHASGQHERGPRSSCQGGRM